jgi:hypothetical protein
VDAPHWFRVVGWSRERHGLLLGIINYAYAQKMSGVQIGLLNFIWDNPVPFLPGINAHF